MIQKHKRFLFILWSFVIVSYLLFQNFTQDVSPKVLHNESCQQAFDLNQSRLLNVSRLHADLLASWPKDVASPQASMNNLSVLLMEANQKMYGACFVESGEVRPSHQLALDELKKLSQTESNVNWKNYIAILETTMNQLKGVAQ